MRLSVETVHEEAPGYRKERRAALEAAASDVEAGAIDMIVCVCVD